VPDETIDANGRQLISNAEVYSRDDTRRRAALKLLGYDELPDIGTLKRGKFRKLLEDMLGLGMNVLDIAEILQQPAEAVPFIVLSVLGKDKIEMLKKNQAEMTRTMAGTLGPTVVAEMTRILADSKARAQDKIKASEVVGKFSGAIGPDVQVSQTSVTFAPSREMLERYDPGNLSRLLGRTIEVAGGAVEARSQLGRPQDGANEPDGQGRGDGDAVESPAGLGLDVLDAGHAEADEPEA